MTTRVAGSRMREGLLEFLAQQRWFGDKGRAMNDARVRETIPVDWPSSNKRFAVSRVEVDTDAGSSTYQLFSPRADSGDVTPTVDALTDPEFQRGLADAWATGAEFRSGPTRWVVAREGKTPLVMPPNAPITPLAAEQTNSSLVLNRQAILKLYRRLEPGIHPDVEVTRFLTHDRKCMHVPKLLGTIRFEGADGVTVAGMLQEYVEGAVDGWSYALDRFKAGQPFIDDAKRLGEVIRTLHDNLASGARGSAFDARPARVEELVAWETGARETIRRGLAALKGMQRDEALAPVANVVRDILDRAVELMPETRGLFGEMGVSSRIHGDLHLGQVLRSPTGQFFIIDFEGEPTRSLHQRRARSSPMRDVAGMLRSLSYVRFSALGSGFMARTADADGWERDARAAFLDGYFASDEGVAGLLPSDPATADALIRTFELEKAFYELQYELAHRPDWAWIPIRGIARFLA